ncbi:ABC-F family ATP-binding cassette domain-containing protein [Pendulispora albinea]|uniref:ATP-binding cassette domain-containing protein n=1 Tax=Pendulispora albinea TaxID=2741071 RepID=A0ABZ2M9E4_9BACT
MILLESLTKRFGPKILFENVSMQFDPGKRYGLVGANGAGKSTLLKMLAGTEESDMGSISIPSSLRLGVLKQNHFAYDKERILDAVLMGNKALWDAMAEKEQLLAGEVTDEIGIRLGELEGVIAEENGYVAESEAAELLVGLGIPTPKHTDPMSTLPAGYKLRVLLAQVLFLRPDVLLLDEPTNHLDLDSIRWLEQFLVDYKGTLVIVSHDRHFLNAVATHIADIDYQTITVYTGNYSEFVEEKYETRQRAQAQNAAAKKKIAELQSFVDRFGSHASKSKQAQSRVKQIEKLEVKELKRSSLIRPFVRFEMDKPSGRDVLRVSEVTKAFGPEKKIFQGLSLNLNRGDKMAVIGPNGIGKSTLLKLIVGAFNGLDADTKKDTLAPESGEIRWGHDVSVGYFAQDHHEALGETAKGLTAYEWLYSFDKTATQEQIRSILGRLLFSGEAALKKIEALSGGESARLLLAKLLLCKHNVLVLDEPTNHLDIESIEGLLDGLKPFPGTVVVVSHDRHFVAESTNRVLELQPGEGGTGEKREAAKVVEFGGTYDEYLEREGRDYLRK